MHRLNQLVRASVCLAVTAGLSDQYAAGSLHGKAPKSQSTLALDSDLVLDESLVLPSFTTLNCRGHRILPTASGQGTTSATYEASRPAAAIVVSGDRGVDVRNCIIGEVGARFDFGVIMLESKNAGASGHRIHGNEIHARDTAIVFLRVDDARVNDNVITWTNGFGVSFLRDSDRNRVNENTLVSTGAPAATMRVVPGGPFRDVVDDGIFLSALLLTPLLNLVVDGQLYQFPNSEDGHYPSSDDNILEGNYISLPGSSAGKSHAGILVSGNSTRSRLIDNTIDRAGVGIRLAGLMPTQAVTRPGRCMAADGSATPRFCTTDADCFIGGIDSAPIGICSTVSTDIRDLRARNTLVEGNALFGPFNATTEALRVAIFGGNGTVGGVIRRNQVSGSGTEGGILLATYMLETGEVTGNLVHGASFGLLLQQGLATGFAARVYLNDFTGSTSRAIGVLGAYTLPTELSWEGLGNYWEHEAPPCFRLSDTPLPALIQDSHAACAPVAASNTSGR
jgi:nitrous oxidase accessory protein NosD